MKGEEDILGAVWATRDVLKDVRGTVEGAMDVLEDIRETQGVHKAVLRTAESTMYLLEDIRDSADLLEEIRDKVGSLLTVGWTLAVLLVAMMALIGYIVRF